MVPGLVLLTGPDNLAQDPAGVARALLATGASPWDVLATLTEGGLPRPDAIPLSGFVDPKTDLQGILKGERFIDAEYVIEIPLDPALAALFPRDFGAALQIGYEGAADGVFEVVRDAPGGPTVRFTRELPAWQEVDSCPEGPFGPILIRWLLEDLVDGLDKIVPKDGRGAEDPDFPQTIEALDRLGPAWLRDVAERALAPLIEGRATVLLVRD
jgi:hypothetical protein